MADYPKFTLFDAMRWKLLPTQLGGGGEYLWSFKYAWIKHNKQQIKDPAANYNIPAFLLGGVAMNEVGGSDFFDWPAFAVRSFDWSGPSWIDNHLTITKNPGLTSMGAVSIQLRRAAETMGVNPNTLTQSQLNDLALALQSDAANLNIVAKHLQQLLLLDNPSCFNSVNLTDEQVMMVGTRYNFGPQKSYDFIKKESLKSKSYGSVILSRKAKILELLK